MRELLAKRIALATALIALLAAAGFAARRNFPPGAEPRPPKPVSATPAGPAAPQAAAQGRAIYEREMCAACHSVAGEGNTRHPLDNVGMRLSLEDLRMRVAPPPAMESEFPPAVYRVKQQFRELPPAEFDALVEYLRSLK